MSDLQTFTEHRPALFGLAYRMLGSAADAEDIVQEAYLRWRGRGDAEVTSARSFLTTIVTRLCIDEKRSARSRRESYVGPWLPEPLLVDDADPANAAELADSLSLAFLVVLEELAPVERAALLLHDVFGYGYDELADMLDRGEPACRQLVSRARRRIRDRRRRFDADQEAGKELAARFLAACATGDLGGLIDVLAEDVVVWTDGGGKVKSARRPIYGKDKASRFLIAVGATVPAGAVVRAVSLNGQPGLVIEVDSVVTDAIALDVVDRLIVGVRVVSNPDKLSGVQPVDIE